MIQLPHTSDPLTDIDGRATQEMRALLDDIKRAFEPVTATTAELEDIGSDVNLIGKFQFKQLGNTTSGRIVYASGPDAGDPWFFMDGTTAHTPV